MQIGAGGVLVGRQVNAVGGRAGGIGAGGLGVAELVGGVFVHGDRDRGVVATYGLGGRGVLVEFGDGPAPARSNSGALCGFGERGGGDDVADAEVMPADGHTISRSAAAFVGGGVEGVGLLRACGEDDGIDTCCLIMLGGLDC
ncbi:Uncharacterised protein [Mycobacteroides abscessus subsp. abscessus]|nr:Uncharacterised protein [Mycobacteroides abscessus subsp. abscessus]